MSTPIEFDRVIVGAGIVGAMTAYLTARRDPSLRVLLLDQGMVGGGTSAYSAGLDVPLARTALHRRAVSRSRQLYSQVRFDIPNLPIRPLQAFFAANDADPAQGHPVPELCGTRLRSAGPRERSMLLDAYPGLSVPEDQSLWQMTAPAFRASVRDVTEQIIGYVRRSFGAQCWTGVRVDQISGQEDRVVITCADGSVVHSASAVIATGPWMNGGPAGAAAANAGLRVKQVAAMHIERQPEPGAPVLYFAADDAFLMPCPDEGRWVFSFPSDHWDREPDTRDLAITSRDQEIARSILRRYVPAFENDMRGGRVWCDGYPADRVPLAVPSLESPRVVLAGGCSGSGYRLAPAIAETALGMLDPVPVIADATPASDFGGRS
jgi:glycine/D-amino acid oxidase-like deaminating enzyme